MSWMMSSSRIKETKTNMLFSFSGIIFMSLGFKSKIPLDSIQYSLLLACLWSPINLSNQGLLISKPNSFYTWMKQMSHIHIDNVESSKWALCKLCNWYCRAPNTNCLSFTLCIISIARNKSWKAYALHCKGGTSFTDTD